MSKALATAGLVRDDGAVVRVLDEYSEVPLYIQLADELEKRIRAGEFRERRQLPSRRGLIEQYGISPQTADKGIRVLDERRLVSRHQGKGVFALPLEELPPPLEGGTRP